MTRVRTFGACAALGAIAISGCGGGARQDVHEPNGNFPVKVAASFPAQQRIASPTTMRIAVHNTGHHAIPNVAVTVDSFDTVSAQQGLADPSRPLWIVDTGPVGGDTAYVNTWALGRLAAGATKNFRWRVTPTVAGTHKLTWIVAAGLNGKAKAHTAGGQRPHGAFTVHVSGKPADASVDPATGAVIRAG